MKRIAFVNGPATSLNQLMRGQLEFLRTQGVQIDLYCGGPNDDLIFLRERGVGRVLYVPFRREPSPLWDLISLIWLTVLLSLRSYDAVIYSTPKAMFLGSLAAFFTGQPYRIAMVRGRAYENFQGRKRRPYVAFDRLTFWISNRVLFVSPSLKSAYAEDGLDPGPKGEVVGYGSSNGVDLDRFRPATSSKRRQIRSELGLSADDFVIVVIIRVRRDKGAAEILELSRRLCDLPALRIVIVGKIEDPGIRDALEAQSRERVRLYPPTSEVERFFQIADLHLLLSHREGFGNVAIEAAAAGVPTFGFDVVGVRNSVVSGVTGQLFEFGDLDSVETAIRAAVNAPEGLRDRYKHARETVADRFAQSRVWRNYARIFLRDGPARPRDGDLALL